MTITAVILLSILTTLATIALLLFAVKRYWRGRRHSFSHKSHHYQDARIKHRTNGRSRSIEGPLALVEEVLQLDSGQLTLWEPLKKEIIDCQHDLAEYLEALPGADGMEQSLNRLEDLINDGLIIFRRLKPKLNDFYNSLNGQQQHEINALFSGGSFGNKYCGYRCRMI